MLHPNSKPPVIVSDLSKSSPTEGAAKVLSPELPVSRGERQFWLDGSAVIAGTAILSTSELDKVIPLAATHWTLQQISDWWALNAKNPCALYIQDEQQDWVACLPDPLGGAIVFTLTENGTTLVSTSTVRLVEVANSYGIEVSKDPLFQIERLTIGNGGLVNNSYKGITSIEPFEFIKLHAGQLQVREFSGISSYEDATNFELFSQLRSDVLTSVNAIASSNASQVISHLTGGFDSRLVLSSVLNLGINNKVLMFCSGPEGSTDRVIADGLTRQFGLRRSDGAGLTAAPTNNMSERLMGALFSSGGITNTGPLGREIRADVAAMGGGYGEVLRSFYGNREITVDGKLDTELVIKRYMPSFASGNSYISKDAQAEMSTRIRKKFSYLNTKYRDVDFIGDAFYTHNRNRYHIGQTSLLWSRVGARFDPLYSVAGFELSKRMTQSSRAANVIGHDLMESLHRDLLSYPFDYDRYNDLLLVQRRRQKPKTFPSADTRIRMTKAVRPEITENSTFLNVLKSLDVPAPELTSEKRLQLTKEANKLGVNFWQVVYRETGQQLLAKAFEATSGSEIYNYLDSSYVKTLSTSDKLNKKQLRDLYSLGSIISWISFA